MKLFLSLLLVAVVYAVEDRFIVHTSSDLKLLVGECITELNITPELALALRRWDLPDDDRGFVRCILKRMQLFDDKTGFNTENLELQLEHNVDLNRVKMIIEKCTDNRLNLDLNEMFALRGAQCMIAEKLTLVREE